VFFYQPFLVIFTITVEAAEAAVTLLATADTLALWDLLGTLWADILLPTLK